MSPSSQSLAAAIVRFIQAVEPMKNHTRTAWGSTGRSESVAEHSWRLALLAMVVAPHLDGVDPGRLVELCLVHDLGETFEGDISAPLQEAGDNKGETERSVVAELAGILDAEDGRRVRDLWQEYDAARTPEALAAKALDKIETIIQHNQGANPADFDYDFNLGYGSALTHDGPLLQAIRALADEQTRARSREQSNREAPAP
jgi:5'-deoxynucleotidase YfbR-like HD superfamily hydrolase